MYRYRSICLAASAVWRDNPTQYRHIPVLAVAAVFNTQLSNFTTKAVPRSLTGDARYPKRARSVVASSSPKVSQWSGAPAHPKPQNKRRRGERTIRSTLLSKKRTKLSLVQRSQAKQTNPLFTRRTINDSTSENIFGSQHANHNQSTESFMPVDQVAATGPSRSSQRKAAAAARQAAAELAQKPMRIARRIARSGVTDGKLRENVRSESK
jgi:hypothetical protein